MGFAVGNISSSLSISIAGPTTLPRYPKESLMNLIFLFIIAMAPVIPNIVFAHEDEEGSSGLTLKIRTTLSAKN